MNGQKKVLIMHRKHLLDIFMEEKYYRKTYEYLWKEARLIMTNIVYFKVK